MGWENVLEVVVQRDAQGRYTKVSENVVKRNLTLSIAPAESKGVDLEKLKAKLLQAGVVSDVSEVE